MDYQLQLDMRQKYVEQQRILDKMRDENKEVCDEIKRLRRQAFGVSEQGKEILLMMVFALLILICSSEIKGLLSSVLGMMTHEKDQIFS